MQPWPNAYDFETLLAHFFELHPLHGPHRKKLAELVRKHAHGILEHPDVKYMPAFKVMDLISEMVNHAADIDAEKQLREIEAVKCLEAEFATNAPLLRSFVLEAALERARYEPLMLIGEFDDATAHRASLLDRRWRAMREAHTHVHSLPEAWLHALDSAVTLVISAPTFREYRVGPLLQMFAEMLQYARQLHEHHMPIESLTAHINEKSALWKRYKLKAKRFREADTSQAFDTIPTQNLRFPKHLQ
ncbi:MAG: hypothetical protein ACOYJ2_02645 [Rickettsiales bacterium]